MRSKIDDRDFRVFLRKDCGKIVFMVGIYEGRFKDVENVYYSCSYDIKNFLMMVVVEFYSGRIIEEDFDFRRDWF